MPRYFFRLEHPDGNLCDNIGEQFETVQAASAFAERVARELSRNRPEHAAIGSQLLVVDSVGIIVCRIPMLLEPV